MPNHDATDCFCVKSVCQSAILAETTALPSGLLCTCFHCEGPLGVQPLLWLCAVFAACPVRPVMCMHTCRSKGLLELSAKGVARAEYASEADSVLLLLPGLRDTLVWQLQQLAQQHRCAGSRCCAPVHVAVRLQGRTSTACWHCAWRCLSDTLLHTAESFCHSLQVLGAAVCHL